MPPEDEGNGVTVFRLSSIEEALKALLGKVDRILQLQQEHQTAIVIIQRRQDEIENRARETEKVLHTRITDTREKLTTRLDVVEVKLTQEEQRSAKSQAWWTILGGGAVLVIGGIISFVLGKF